ncbi:MAG: NUDIX hydrolase [Promethearchaeota archaeon]
MEKVTCAGGVVFNNEGKIALLEKASKNEWVIPKGHVEPGETKEEAGLREIREETGLRDLEVVDYIDLYRDEKVRGGKPVLKEVYIYAVRHSGPDEALSPDNIEDHFTGCRWAPLNEALQLLVYPGQKKIVERFAMRQGDFFGIPSYR